MGLFSRAPFCPRCGNRETAYDDSTSDGDSSYTHFTSYKCLRCVKEDKKIFNEEVESIRRQNEAKAIAEGTYVRCHCGSLQSTQNNYCTKCKRQISHKVTNETNAQFASRWLAEEESKSATERFGFTTTAIVAGSLLAFGVAPIVTGSVLVVSLLGRIIHRRK